MQRAALAAVRKAAARRPAACRAALPALGCRLASPLGLTSPPPPPQQWRGLATGGKGGPEEAESHDDFKPQRKAPPADLDGAVQMIEEQVKKHKIMLYMKGTPSRPQCGFSAQIVRVLHASGVDFDSVNVLDYPMIREGVKKYSNWPTIPQLYVDAEFIGGCDIVTSLFQSGELAKIFEESAGGAAKQ